MPSNTLRQVEQSLGPRCQMNKPVLILTRPAPNAYAFLDMIAPVLLARVTVLISPLLRISGTGTPVDMQGIDGVIFTSANGPAFAPEGGGRTAFCVGAKTTQAAEAKGWRAQMLGQTADELIEAVINKRPKGPLLHISGQHQRGDIARRLSDAGIKTTAVNVYDQTLLPLTPQAKSALTGGKPCIAPLFSPRTATQFARECDDLRHVIVIALSPAVADALGDKHPQQLLIADEPTANSMRLVLETVVDWDRLA